MSYLLKSKMFYISLLMSLLGAIFAILVQFFRGNIVDTAFSGGNLIVPSIFFVGSIITELIFFYFYERTKKKTTLDIGSKMKINIFEASTEQAKDFTSLEKSTITNDISKQTDLLKDNYFGSYISMANMIISSVLIVIAMAGINIFIPIIVIIMLLNQIFLPKLLSKYLNKLNTNYVSKTQHLLEKLDDIFSNMPLIFNFTLIGMMKKKAHLAILENDKSEYSRFNGNNLLRCINALNSYATHFIIFIICAYMLLNGSLGIATFYIIMGLVEQLTMPLIGISYAYQNIVGNRDLAKRLTEDYTNQSIDEKDDYQDFKEVIKINKLYYKINNQNIVNGISRIFAKNKKYLIQGESGSGKTTLLKILNQNISSYEGSILIDSIDYKDVNIKKCIGMMSDKPSFLKGTIRENILLGSYLKDDKIKELLEKMRLPQLVDRLDEEISYIDENLSLGERKRIELLRLLIKDFDILLLDEPTSNLDTINRSILIDFISKCNDKTIICTSHETEIDFISIFDEVIQYG
ncbi:MAG: ABC transporter ATP-binding protein/permease [Defluviitaleaceae bacterium]|nr:ABC transporter ATP-binding protein/permease [Defluviitaleaceae bacterium]